MEICRACLSTGMDMIVMDDTLVEDFRVLTNLNVEHGQGMPFFACEECSIALKFCTQFRSKCIASYNTLKEIFFESQETDQENVESNDDSVEHKIEIKFEDDGDEVWKMEQDELTKDEENLTCGLCPDILNGKEALLDHLGIHKLDKICFLCQHRASDVAQLLAHRTKHIPIEDSECLFCGKIFMSTASLAFHYMTTHKRDIHNEWTDQDSDSEEKVLYIPEEIPVSTRKSNYIVPKNVVLDQNDIKNLMKPAAKGISPFFCGLCPLEFDEKSEAVKHLSTHKNDTACSICERKSQSYPNLLAHRMTHVPSNQNGCLFCDNFFRSPMSLEFHYLRVHNLGEKDNMPFVCKLCHRGYATSEKLKSHQYVRHSSRKYTCEHCSKTFTSRTSIIVHLSTHEEKKLFKCDVCDFSCKLPSGLNDHKIRCHVETRVYCNTCRRAFPTQLLLDKHRPCKVVDRVCPLCGINLKPSSSLNRHMQCHNADAWYKCEQCPSKYRSKSAFNDHMNKHRNDRKYRCPYCPKKFFSQPVLIKHRRIHTGEKPYVCKLCDKGFTGNHNLKVHMRVHGLDLINKREKT